jgi:asparagine synthase (glutamine-hydrolysing)
MCGILGIIGEKIEQDDLKALLNGINHRGPDSFGIWKEDTFGISFGHRRLAILDLTPSGHQPMESHDGRYVIVFNGEIYNYLELQRELKFKNWKGHSDTEIMLQCFTEWGIDKTLEKLTGMFAFALWDKELKKVILARDRFGEKPLYVGRYGSGIFFTSELSPFHRIVNPELKLESLNYFFQLGYIPHPHTCFKDVFKLTPGSYLVIDPLAPEINIESAKKFWSFIPGKPSEEVKGGFSNALDEFETKLKEVVRKQMISDVPIGAFLSGGVDSSTIVAIAQSISSKPIKTFSLGIKDQIINEAIFAKQIASHLKTDHHEFLVTSKEVLDLTPKLVGGFDEPFSDPSLIPTWIVSKMAKTKVTVSLSGDGGDELFGGYASYRRADKILKFRKFIPSFITPEIIPEIKWKNLGYRTKKAISIMKKNNYEDIFAALVVHSSVSLLKNKNFPSFPMKLHEQSREGAMWWDATHYMSDDILVKVDRMSMKHSLEVRVPLMDHELVEWVWGLPKSYRYNDQNSKILLKELLYRHVPRDLVDRPKTGFGLPLGTWLKKDLKEWAFSSIFHNEDILDMDLIRKLWDEHQSGVKDNKTILWNVICFNEWFKNFKKNRL